MRLKKLLAKHITLQSVRYSHHHFYGRRVTIMAQSGACKAGNERIHWCLFERQKKFTLFLSTPYGQHDWALPRLPAPYIQRLLLLLHHMMAAGRIVKIGARYEGEDGQ